MLNIILAAVIGFASVSAHADGIPVPMNQQTPYNWNCDNQVSFHVFIHANQPKSTVYIHSNSAGTVGASILLSQATQLLKKDYTSINGVKISDSGVRRETTFFNVNGTLTVRMLDVQNSYLLKADHCRATF